MFLIIEPPATGAGRLLVEAMKELQEDFIYFIRSFDRYDDDKTFKTYLKSGTSNTLFIVDATNVENIKNCFDKIENNHLVTGCLCFSDKCMYAAAVFAESKGWFFPSPKAVLSCINKTMTRQVLSKISDLAVASRAFHSLEDAYSWTTNQQLIRFPLIIKSSHGTGSGEVKLCTGRENLKKDISEISQKNLSRGGQIMIEEFITGPLFSVEVIKSNGTTHILGFTSSNLEYIPYFIETKCAHPFKMDYKIAQKLQRIITKFLDEIHFDNGLAHIEFILSFGDPYIIEVNPRFIGATGPEVLSIAYRTNIFSQIIAGIQNRKFDELIKLKPQSAAAANTIYKDKAGIVQRVSAPYFLSHNKNVHRLDLKVKPGDLVDRPISWKGAVAELVVEGENAQLAQMYCDSLTSYLEITCEELSISTGKSLCS